MPRTLFAAACAAALALSAPLAAQNAPADSAAPVTARYTPRASWLSDQRGFVVGDILTVVVDEQTVASERTNQVSNATRSQTNRLTAGSGSGTPTAASFQTGADAASNNTGTAGRQGQLTATLSVRVAEVNPDGSLRIQGQREVVVDGRKQQMTLTGLVRAQDVSPQNVVLSSRVADASISYKGNGLSPKRGLLGRLLGLFWP